jgi:glycosyltransferase involved in cell wall biosynthesis/SAM-dependent methyltransferase
MNEILQIYSELLKEVSKVISEMEALRDEDSVDVVNTKYVGITQTIGILESVTSESVYKDYKEFFTSFKKFGDDCKEISVFEMNLQQAYDSLRLFRDCINEIITILGKRVHICPCCKEKVIYNALPSYYSDMSRKYNAKKARPETLNEDEYLCPKCGSSDRDRLIISYLEKINVKTAKEGLTLLQIAPAESIDRFLRKWCPNLEYHTTDLYMDGVTFKSDIQNMTGVTDGSYDLIICSHVLEHVQDDRQALKELKRVLKDDGQIVFLVPIDLDATEIDEEWGCSEEENWRRFGQGDHCRAYSKQGLVDRLEEQFYVHQLGMNYFGKETFDECGLTDTSILYVLTKSEEVTLDKGWHPVINKDLCANGPLVSVLLPCYNHEQYVEAAVLSVLNQSYKNLEILVADDASSDTTPEILKKYEDRFASLTLHKENTRDRLGELALKSTGEYIALMHSDDLWDKDKIAIQIQYMEEHKKCGACLTWADYVQEGIQMPENIFYQANRSRKEWLRRFWRSGNCLCNPSSVARRDVFFAANVHGRACVQIPDMFKWVDVLLLCDIYVIQLPLTHMGIHYSGDNPNESSPSTDNTLRSLFEDAVNWMDVLLDMDDELFIDMFGDMFINADSHTKEELQCEKYFMMLHSNVLGRENEALRFMETNMKNLSDILREKYNYNLNDFATDKVEKGYMRLLRK